MQLLLMVIKKINNLNIILKESKILDIEYMEDNNIRFVFVSATMINELHDLYKRVIKISLIIKLLMILNVIIIKNI